MYLWSIRKKIERGSVKGGIKGEEIIYTYYPHLQVWEMVDYPSPGIKKAAIAAIGQFCCSLAKVTQSAQSEEGLAGTKVLKIE